MEPTQSQSEASTATTSVTVADVLRFTLRYGPLVIALALVGSCGASAWLDAGSEDRYRARATLVVQRSILGDGEPELREFEAYRRMLESDAVVAETRARLIERGWIGDKQRLRAGKTLKVETVTTKQVLGRQFTGLVPVLDAVAVLGDAESAAHAANVWTEVFLELLREQQEGDQRAAVNSVAASLEAVNERLSMMATQALEEREVVRAARAKQLAVLDARSQELHGRYLEAADAFEAETLGLLDAALGEPASPLRELRQRVLEESRERGFHGLAWQHEQQQLAIEREREAVEQQATAERKIAVEALEREADSMERVRRRLADELAATEVRALRVHEQPVRVVAPAVPPRRPVPATASLRGVAFGLGLALLGLLGALAREILRAAPRSA